MFSRNYFGTSHTPVPVSPACMRTNYNNDEVVDQADLAIFLACMSGPNVIADRTCDDPYQ